MSQPERRYISLRAWPGQYQRLYGSRCVAISPALYHEYGLYLATCETPIRWKRVGRMDCCMIWDI